MMFAPALHGRSLVTISIVIRNSEDLAPSYPMVRLVAGDSSSSRLRGVCPGTLLRDLVLAAVKLSYGLKMFIFVHVGCRRRSNRALASAFQTIYTLSICLGRHLLRGVARKKELVDFQALQLLIYTSCECMCVIVCLQSSIVDRASRGEDIRHLTTKASYPRPRTRYANFTRSVSLSVYPSSTHSPLYGLCARSFRPQASATYSPAFRPSTLTTWDSTVGQACHL